MGVWADRREKHTSWAQRCQHSSPADTPTRTYAHTLPTLSHRNFCIRFGLLWLYENNSPQECYHCADSRGGSLLPLHYPSSQAYPNTGSNGRNADR